MRPSYQSSISVCQHGVVLAPALVLAPAGTATTETAARAARMSSAIRRGRLTRIGVGAGSVSSLRFGALYADTSVLAELDSVSLDHGRDGAVIPPLGLCKGGSGMGPCYRRAMRAAAGRPVLGAAAVLLGAVLLFSHGSSDGR